MTQPPPRYGETFNVSNDNEVISTSVLDDGLGYWHSFSETKKEREASRRNLEYLTSNGFDVVGRYVDGRFVFDFRKEHHLAPTRCAPPKSKLFCFKRGYQVGKLLGATMGRPRFETLLVHHEKPPHRGFYDEYQNVHRALQDH